jgi:HlyD family secretion protein
VVEGNDRKVQHPTGGVVADLLVRDGDHVRAGDVVLRLDQTVSKANLAIVSKGLDEMSARLARLEAERDGADKVAVPDSLLSRASEPAVQKLLAGEDSLFRLRAEAREGQKAQLGERVSQLEQQIEGLTEQITAKGTQLELIAGELIGVHALFEKNLVPLERVNVLEREAARLKGERGELVAAIAEARGRISETRLRTLQIDQDLRSDVAKEMRETQGKIAELVERKVAAEDQLKRVELLAPAAGVVHQLAVHTLGGVVNAGEPIMLIVPDSERLLVEVRIAPQDIDNVRAGQVAALRLVAFNQRTTPEVTGTVQRVSADLNLDQKSGTSFYSARIALDPTTAVKIGTERLVAGMPIEAFIQTVPRTVLSYLTRPLADQVRRAFREE